MALQKTRSCIIGGLIALSVLFLGLSQAMAQPDFLKITEPEFLEISKPEIGTVSDQEPLGISNPDSLEISEPRNMPPGTFQNGAFVRPERPNPAYDRCAQMKGFEAQRKCALEALNLAVEEEQ